MSHAEIFDSPAYYTAMQDHYDEIREEEASPTLMPIEAVAYDYIRKTAQHQDTHGDEQCDACAQKARALLSLVGPIVAALVLEDAAERVGNLPGGGIAAEELVTLARDERDCVSPEAVALMGWADAEGGA